MIDFRFHLISIVAVLLALGLGILAGSGLLGDELIDAIRTQVDEVREINADLREGRDQLARELDAESRFAQAARPRLVAGALAGETVVLFRFEGIEGTAVQETIGALEEAGAQVTSTVSFTDKLALEEDIAREQLSLMIRSTAIDAAELRAEMSSILATRVGAAADASRAGARRLEASLTLLEDDGFATVDRRGDVPVAEGSSAVILGGDAGDPPFAVSTFTHGLATALTREGLVTVIAETSGSSWDMVTTIREDAGVRDALATVDGIEAARGQVALVLALDEVLSGEPPDHYGFGPGASQPLPDPASP